MSEVNVTNGNLTIGNKTVNSTTFKKAQLGTTIDLNSTDSELNFALGNKQK